MKVKLNVTRCRIRRSRTGLGFEKVPELSELESAFLVAGLGTTGLPAGLLAGAAFAVKV